MKLDTEFYKLPLRFDTERLIDEISHLSESDWITHPTAFLGNTALILVSVGGEINDDFAISGPMQPTRFLERCPYIKQVMKALDAPISRSRLMRIAARGEVPPHRDSRYHWFRRMRIHVPIVTNYAVKFFCNNKVVHMAAGEAWTFNNSLRHWVVNGMEQDRIHLVIDTKRSLTLKRMLEQAEQPYATNHTPGNVHVRYVPYLPDEAGQILLEPYYFEVLTPQEIDDLTAEILSDAENSQMLSSQFQRLVEKVEEFRSQWENTFSRFGHEQAGETAYQSLIAHFQNQIASEVKNVLPPSGSGEYAIRTVSTMLSKTNRQEKPVKASTP